MYKIIRIQKKILNELLIDFYRTVSIILKKKISSFDIKFFKILDDPIKRSKVFDCLNMSLALQRVNHEISKKKVEKIIKKKLLIGLILKLD